jgi:hypothetical protein
MGGLIIIRIILNRVWECGLDLIGPGLGPVKR